MYGILESERISVEMEGKQRCNRSVSKEETDYSSALASLNTMDLSIERG